MILSIYKIELLNLPRKIRVMVDVLILDSGDEDGGDKIFIPLHCFASSPQASTP
jgi:hypothetical protein